MNDLQVNVEQHLGFIECNFQELKEELALQMTAYTSLEITEEGQKEAKSDLATLRKMRKAVDDERKKVKKEFMKPYTDFENEVKELLSVIDEPIGMIDGKLKEFEAERVQEKLKHLTDLYKEHIGDYAEYLPYHMVANDKWTNATYSDKDVIFDISEAVTRVRSDIDAIKALHSEIEEDCLTAYKNNGNSLVAAVTKNSDYLNAKEKAVQKVREESEQKAKEEEVTVETGDDVLTIRIQGEDNIAKVKEYLDFAEISYEILTYKEV